MNTKEGKGKEKASRVGREGIKGRERYKRGEKEERRVQQHRRKVKR
jgi:hypothetical protein